MLEPRYSMLHKYLKTYLIDHLAGSVAAIEILHGLRKVYADTALARFFADLQNDIAADQRQLQSVMHRLQITESRPRKLSAWLTEKLIELKLRVDDGSRGSLRLLESLEVIGLGIHGKLAMWHALKAAAEEHPLLRDVVDYERLAERAEEQRRRLEVVRLEAAKVAFTGRCMAREAQ
jgi:hypothetical protein